MDKEKLKKELASLGEDEREMLRELLTTKKDDSDLIESILKIEKRIEILEGLLNTKQTTPKEKSFLEKLFE